MYREFDNELESKEFAKKVRGIRHYAKWCDKWIVIWDESNFNLKPFIKHCLSDEEFWQRGGIPTKENYYINKLNMTDEQVGIFYEHMIGLLHLEREIAKQENI